MLLRVTGRSRRTLAAASALALTALLATVANAFAYNLNGTYWPKVSGPPSTVVKIYLDASLTAQEVNLKPVVRNTIDEYNALPALNPWLDEISNDNNEKIFVKAQNLGDPEVFAQATRTVAGNTITYALIEFNTLVIWKTTIGGSCYDPPGSDWVCTQDARKTSNHEMGHAQGLAHEFSPTTAVMRQGFLSYFHVQDDDEDGIVEIYGAYNP